MVIDVSGVGGTKLPTRLAGVCTLLALVGWTLGGYRAFEASAEILASNHVRTTSHTGNWVPSRY